MLWVLIRLRDECLFPCSPRASRARGRQNHRDHGATLDDLRESVETLEDTERTARRVFGGAHPNVRFMEGALQQARTVLRARETPGSA